MKITMAPVYLACIVLLSACATTRITSSWSEPDKKVSIQNLHKVLIVALFKTDVNRRKAEEQMAGYLEGKGVVSYNYLSQNFNTSNADAIRDKIKEDGFDGAVTMRLIDVDKEQVYNPGFITGYPSYYHNFGGYFYRNWQVYQTPGYYSTSKSFIIETNVFSIKEDKIIWTGLTETTNPDGVQKMTEEVTQIVFKKMLKEGFITR